MMNNLIKTTLAVVMLASPVSANYVLKSVPELSEANIEWLNKHRTDKDHGTHENFFWIRLPSGKIFSVSIQQYRESEYGFSGDFDKYFESKLDEKIQQETDDARLQFTRGITLLEDLIASGMSQETALVLVKFNVPGFGYDVEKDDLYYIDPITQVHIN